MQNPPDAPQKKKKARRVMDGVCSYADALPNQLSGEARYELLGEATALEFPEEEVPCPRCGKRISYEDACAGFSDDDPRDFRTRCPGCNHAFVTTRTAIICNSDGWDSENFIWMTAEQTRAALDDWERANGGPSPAHLITRAPSVMWNMKLHKMN
jgi:hypothetical protein